jgi:hypothetical protein
MTAVSNFFSSYEGDRYPFQVDAFFVILFGIALEQLRRKAFRLAKEAVWWLSQGKCRSRHSAKGTIRSRAGEYRLGS